MLFLYYLFDVILRGAELDIWIDILFVRKITNFMNFLHSIFNVYLFL
jgi:hypothetical protein